MYVIIFNHLTLYSANNSFAGLLSTVHMCVCMNVIILQCVKKMKKSVS